MKSVSFSLCVGFVMLGIVLGSRPFSTTPRLEPTELVESVGRLQTNRRPTATGHRSFLSPHASPIASRGDFVFVVNTPADTLDVIDAKTHSVAHRIRVGVEPVSVAIRPDGKEVWVANHISDSVSVIDHDPKSKTYLQVIATIQDFGRRKRSTQFDEPVGIAFASNQKAYVALSSENEIAVVDVASRDVVKRLKIRSLQYQFYLYAANLLN